MKLILGLVLFILLLVLGCGPQITKGHVVNKKFVAAHDETVNITIDETNIPITTHYPDAWYITFENFVESGKVSKTIKVPKNTYNDYKIGDWYEEAKNE